jgi:hypothetical protein
LAFAKLTFPTPTAPINLALSSVLLKIADTREVVSFKSHRTGSSFFGRYSPVDLEAFFPAS